MLTVTFSNHLESLLEILLERTDSVSSFPFEVEEIVVPSAAIRRKLELGIADRRGICANVNFSFLGSWVLEKSLPNADAHAFSVDTLTWQIFRILSDEEFVSQHARLLSWMSKTQDPVMRLDLAQRIAPLIEQYALYRPEWLHAWATDKKAFSTEKGTSEDQDQGWQAALWRRIINGQRSTHPWVEMHEWLNSQQSARRQGSVAHIFCPPAISPLYVRALHRLAQSADAHLYLLNPCREFWFDIVDARRFNYLKARSQEDYHETGNSLLAAWGKQTQSTLKLLFDDDALCSHESSHFSTNRESVQPSSLLAEVQDAILELRNAERGSISVCETDRSLEVHVCHSLARELEVLQDQLLAAFASDSTLLPEDVLVVTPNLEQAAPLIDAVFGTANTERRIPYSISGRKGSRENVAAKALLDLLALVSSRFLASDVFNLLRQPIIARKCSLQEADLNLVHDWMHDSGIRWSLNANHKVQLGLPESERYSFRDGLYRLFLGYALPADFGMPYSGRLPAGNPEGSPAIALGCFWYFVQQLEAVHTTLQVPQAPGKWLHTLMAILQQFMLPNHNEQDELRETHHKIRELCNLMQQGCGAHPIALAVMQKALTDHLDNTAGATIPTGVVTFTSMSSLRNLPYRMICAIGINDGAFPSNQRPAEFDLMAKRFKSGDRQRRDDDRNLFLDLLLAARERFYLSYTGRSVRDNEKMPPSVLISDLLDYILPTIASERREAEKRLIVEHPLQPFSLQAYLESNDNRVRSSHQEYYEALLAKQQAQNYGNWGNPADDFFDEEDEDAVAENAQVFFTEALPPLDGAWREVSLEQLIQFFRNPSRYLLQQRLGIRFPEHPEELQDEEPFLPEWEERSALADRLLPRLLEKVPFKDIEISAKAGSEYPQGKLGETLLNKELQAMNTFAEAWRALSDQTALPTISGTLQFAIEDECWHLTGSVGDLKSDGLHRYRFDETRPSDYLAGWINHLFMNVIAPDEVKKQTVWHSRDGQYKLNPVDNAYEYLQNLLALFRQGLTAPLPFYPKSAWAYASNNQNLRKAEEKWRNSRNEAFGESHNPDIRQTVRGIINPLDSDFEACAKQVFAPLLQHLEDDRLKIGKGGDE